MNESHERLTTFLEDYFNNRTWNHAADTKKLATALANELLEAGAILPRFKIGEKKWIIHRKWDFELKDTWEKPAYTVRQVYVRDIRLGGDEIRYVMRFVDDGHEQCIFPTDDIITYDSEAEAQAALMNK